MMKAWTSPETQEGPAQECINRRMDEGIGLSIHWNITQQQKDHTETRPFTLSKRGRANRDREWVGGYEGPPKGAEFLLEVMMSPEVDCADGAQHCGQTETRWIARFQWLDFMA